MEWCIYSIYVIEFVREFKGLGVGNVFCLCRYSTNARDSKSGSGGLGSF